MGINQHTQGKQCTFNLSNGDREASFCFKCHYKVTDLRIVHWFQFTAAIILTDTHIAPSLASRKSTLLNSLLSLGYK